MYFGAAWHCNKGASDFSLGGGHESCESDWRKDQYWKTRALWPRHARGRQARGRWIRGEPRRGAWLVWRGREFAFYFTYFVSKRIQEMISRRWFVSKYISLRQPDTTYSDIEKETKEASLSSAYIKKKNRNIATSRKWHESLNFSHASLFLLGGLETPIALSCGTKLNQESAERATTVHLTDFMTEAFAEWTGSDTR